MSETDRGRLPTSKVELAVTIINGSPTYAKSPILAKRLPNHLLPTLLSSCKLSSISNNSPQPLISLCF